MKTNLGRILLLIIGFIMPILMIETTIRLLKIAPPPVPNPTIWEMHPELGWWHIPDSGGTFYSSYNEFQADVYINSLGLRDEQTLTDYAISEDKLKILVLADSFGEALQVPLEKTFFKQLQSKLIAKGIDSQTINGGTGSWGTDQELTFYRQQGYKYKPDITLLFFFTRNDTVNNYDRLEVARNGGSIQKSFYHLADDGNLIYPFSYDPDAPKPDWLEKRPSLPHAKWLDTADWLWLNSHLYRWAVPYVRDMPFMLHTFGASGILGGEGHIRAFHPTIPIPFFVYQSPPTETWQNAWQLTEAIIADLAYQVEQDNGKFVVIIIPAKEQVYPQAWQRILASHAEMQAMSWDLDEPNQQLIDILQRHDIPYFDLLPVFMDYHYVPNKPSLYFHHDGHWNEAGHELTAEAVLYFLFKSRLVY